MLANRMVMSSVVEPVIATFQTSAVDATGATTYSFTSQAIGTAANNRIVVVAADTNGGAAGSDGVSSMTIGGISATLVKASLADDHCQAELWEAVVPTGTTATVAVTWNSARGRCGIGIWAVYNAKFTPHATAEDNHVGTSSAATSVSINVPASGACIGCVSAGAASAATFTWAGVTEKYDEVVSGLLTHGGASDVFTTQQVGLTVSATPSVATRQAMPVASWSPL
jgi:hypothetical protein